MNRWVKVMLGVLVLAACESAVGPECTGTIGDDVLLLDGTYTVLGGDPGIASSLPIPDEAIEVVVDVEASRLRASYTLDGKEITEVWRLENRQMVNW